jgi:hypothetical protein
LSVGRLPGDGSGGDCNVAAPFRLSVSTLTVPAAMSCQNRFDRRGHCEHVRTGGEPPGLTWYGTGHFPHRHQGTWLSRYSLSFGAPNAGTLGEPRPAPPPRAGIDPDVPDQRERRRRALFLVFPEGAPIFALGERMPRVARGQRSQDGRPRAPNRRGRMLSGSLTRLQNAKIKLQEIGARVSRNERAPIFAGALSLALHQARANSGYHRRPWPRHPPPQYGRP